MSLSPAKDPLRIPSSRDAVIRCMARVPTDPNFVNVAEMGWSDAVGEPELAGVDFSTYTAAGGTNADLFLRLFADNRAPLQLGKTYKFRCFARYPGAPSDETVTSEVLVRILGPPTAGNCTINPAQGSALITKFNVSMLGFTASDPSGEPLTYALRRLESDGTRVPVVAPQESSNILDVLLPAGLPVTLVGIIADANGAVVGANNMFRELYAYLP
eukprot:tig00020685_g12963.t1